MNAINKFNFNLLKVMETIISSGIIIIACVLFLNVASRFVLNNGISWAEELCAIAVVIYGFCGVCYAAACGTHVVVSVIYDVMPFKVKKPLTILSNVVCIGFALLWCYISAGYIYALFESGRASPSLMIPLWIPYSMMPIGFLFTAFQFFLILLNNLKEWDVIHNKLISVTNDLDEDDPSKLIEE